MRPGPPVKIGSPASRLPVRSAVTRDFTGYVPQLAGAVSGIAWLKKPLTNRKSEIGTMQEVIQEGCDATLAIIDAIVLKK